MADGLPGRRNSSSDESLQRGQENDKGSVSLNGGPRPGSMPPETTVLCLWDDGRGFKALRIKGKMH